MKTSHVTLENFGDYIKSYVLSTKSGIHFLGECALVHIFGGLLMTSFIEDL